jgi:hypothetical protein
MRVAAVEGSEIPVVTLLGAFGLTVATRRGFARRVWSVALESVLELTAGRTTVVWLCPAVVALLKASDDAIATFRSAACNAGLQANPTRFEFAIGAAAIRAACVVVVTLLWRVDARIPAHERGTSRARGRAPKALFDHHAVRSAPVSITTVPVIAGFDRLALAVATVVVRSNAATSSVTAGARDASCASTPAHRVPAGNSCVCPTAHGPG